jgi:DNA replication protein DnaD
MARAMLEYYKTVLQKVSFDLKLFSKELQKAISRLLPNEIEELKKWLHLFITDYPELKPSLVYLKA